MDEPKIVVTHEEWVTGTILYTKVWNITPEELAKLEETAAETAHSVAFLVDDGVLGPEDDGSEYVYELDQTVDVQTTIDKSGLTEEN